MGTIPCKKKKHDEAKVGNASSMSDKNVKSNIINEEQDEQEQEEENIMYDYIQGELIEEGCNVFSALNTLNGQLLALKIFKLREEDEFQQVIITVDKLMRLEHENIHEIFGWDYAKENNQIIENEISILMPYESGGSISWLLQKFSKFSPQLAAMFMKQILQGLEYLHDKGIYHKNLKTSNVLVDGEANAKLSDIYILNNYKLSMYSAPECFNGQGYSEYSDVWSAGCIFMEMLTKMHPWYHLSTNITIEQIRYSINQGKIFPYKSVIRNDNILKILNQIFKINPKERPTPTQLLGNNLFNNLETEPLKSVVLSTRRQNVNHTRYEERKSQKMQTSNFSSQSIKSQVGFLSSMSIRRSNNQDSKYYKMLQQINSIHQDCDQLSNVNQQQLMSHNDVFNVITKKIQIESKIQQQLNRDNVLVENGLIRPKDGINLGQNIPDKLNGKIALPKPPINASQHKSIQSNSLDKIQTVRSSDYNKSLEPQTDRIVEDKNLSETEKLEQLMAQQFYQEQNNQIKIQNQNDLNDIEKMMMAQFQSSIQINEDNSQQQSQQQQKQQSNPQENILKTHSDIIISQERPKEQNQDYFEQLMQQQFMQDDDEIETDELQQLEDLIFQQYYSNQQNNKIKSENEIIENDKQSNKSNKKQFHQQPTSHINEDVEDKKIDIMISIVAFDKLIQSPKFDDHELVIEDDFIYML